MKLLDRNTGRFHFPLPLANGTPRTTYVPGHPLKVYGQENSGRWIAFHSVVGEETEFQDGIPDRFLSDARDAAGRFTPYAAASAMGVLRKSGLLIQMYPIWKGTWTSGGPVANTGAWAFEVEGGHSSSPGGHSERWTDQQLVTAMLICAAHEEFHDGKQVTRDGNRPVNGTLVEHNEFAKEFGYDPTACPSGRNQRLYEAVHDGSYRRFVKEYVGMWVPDAEWRALLRAVFAGGEEAGNPESVRDSNAVYRMNERAAGRGVSVADHAASAYLLADEAKKAAGAGGTGAVGKHKHLAVVQVQENVA